MPVISLCGIVTRYVNYRESDRIISILTAERGRVDAKARGCLRATSPLLPGVQPFAYGRYALYQGRDKFTVNQCETLESFYPIREDYRRFSAASAALQLAHEAAQENQRSDALFSLLYHSLSFLAYGAAEPMDLLCCYLIRYLNVCGYRPSITTCARCARDIRGDAVLRFSPAAGGVICAGCGGGETISKTALEAMRRMLLLNDDEMDRVRLSAPIRQELLARLCDYLAASLEYGPRALMHLDLSAV
ncbi:MAG: DNA repair protein RecO [Clostridia bacterium]|nr:DNA repair protein RecO [Clostridia bacterium]